jgi:1,2-diacylglycerol 3-beta-galactosyltransferase
MAERNILILMSNTGGGHRAAAYALKAGFRGRFGDRYRVEIIDLLMDHLPWPLRDMPRSYSVMVRRAPWLWKCVWDASLHPLIVRPMTSVASRWANGTVQNTFVRYEPSLIIAVHPLALEIAAQTLRRMRLEIPLISVVTDLVTAHPLWFHSDVCRCFVASEEARRRAIDSGLYAGRVRLSGIPLHPEFAKAGMDRHDLRRHLCMDADLPAVLLIGGGDGVGPVAKIARRLGDVLQVDGKPIGQLAVICGRNEPLQLQLARQNWPVPAQIRGFVHNISQWMWASNCLVTKAGPGTIAEALVCGLPMVISGYIPGQEEGNVPFVAENRVGTYCSRADDVADLVRDWFTKERDQLTQMAANARRLARPQATTQIVDECAALLGQGTRVDTEIGDCC